MRIFFDVFLHLLTFAAVPAETPSEIFDRRIKPIFASPEPSSCIECHLAGVELKNYIQPSAEKTFLSLRDQGLIDLDRPRDSRILALIAMGESAPNLIRNEMRRREHEAFADWIAASVADPRLRNAPALPAAERTGPRRPVAVIRHARRDRLLASFERHVWAQRFRCSSCHMPGGADVERLVAEQGDDDFLWLRPEGADATMTHLLAQNLIDLRTPARSRLLRKATGEIKHGGGQKLEIGDLGYQEIRRWIEDYAAVMGDKFKRAEDLPPPSADDARELVGTDVWLKIENTPARWSDRLLQVDVFPIGTDGRAAAERVATSDRLVFGKNKLWQHVLVLDRRRGDPGAARLAPGRYRVRVLVDKARKLARNWRHRLDARDVVGETEIETPWSPGYGKMTVVDAATLGPAR